MNKGLHYTLLWGRRGTVLSCTFSRLCGRNLKRTPFVPLVHLFYINTAQYVPHCLLKLIYSTFRVTLTVYDRLLHFQKKKRVLNSTFSTLFSVPVTFLSSGNVDLSYLKLWWFTFLGKRYLKYSWRCHNSDKERYSLVPFCLRGSLCAFVFLV